MKFNYILLIVDFPGKGTGYPTVGIEIRRAQPSTARITVDFLSLTPRCTQLLRVGRVIPQCEIHVSASLRFHPGRSDFPSPVGDHSFPHEPSLITPKLKCQLTYAPCVIGLLIARHLMAVTSLFGSESEAVPLRCPLCAKSPFARSRCYLLRRNVYRPVRGSYPSFIAHTGSCAKPNASHRLQLSLFR
jgi:hypothetical protein